jgi:hypothetical protein
MQPVTFRSNYNMSRAWPPMSLAAHLSLRLRIVREWITSASVRPQPTAWGDTDSVLTERGVAGTFVPND